MELGSGSAWVGHLLVHHGAQIRHGHHEVVRHGTGGSAAVLGVAVVLGFGVVRSLHPVRSRLRMLLGMTHEEVLAYPLERAEDPQGH